MLSGQLILLRVYVYEDGGFGNYNIVAKVSYVNEDVAIEIMEVLDNEQIDRVPTLVNTVLKGKAFRRGSYSVHNTWTNERRSGRGNVAISGKQSGGNTR